METQTALWSRGRCWALLLVVLGAAAGLPAPPTLTYPQVLAQAVDTFNQRPEVQNVFRLLSADPEPAPVSPRAGIPAPGQGAAGGPFYVEPGPTLPPRGNSPWAASWHGWRGEFAQGCTRLRPGNSLSAGKKSSQPSDRLAEPKPAWLNPKSSMAKPKISPDQPQTSPEKPCSIL
uniref:Uncharacterized protein n=1 Tax=Dromaius novaehollandiae TaxID=8790 RepID=A0A8C4JLF8_DRONO